MKRSTLLGMMCGLASLGMACSSLLVVSNARRFVSEGIQTELHATFGDAGLDVLGDQLVAVARHADAGVLGLGPATGGIRLARQWGARRG